MPSVNALLRDMHGQPVAVLSAPSSRDIATLGRRTTLMLMSAVALVLAACTGAVTFLILRLRQSWDVQVATERRHRQTLDHVGEHDALTELPNRVHLRKRLPELLQKAKRIGRRSRCCTWISITSNTSTIREPVPLHDVTLSMTASIGVAVYPGDGIDAEALLKHADIALYRAKQLGIDTIAEGIETIEQLDCLRHMGCHRGQGYHVSKPVPAEQCRALFKQMGEMRRLTETVKARAQLCVLSRAPAA